MFTIALKFKIDNKNMNANEYYRNSNLNATGHQLCSKSVRPASSPIHLGCDQTAAGSCRPRAGQAGLLSDIPLPDGRTVRLQHGVQPGTAIHGMAT